MRQLAVILVLLVGLVVAARLGYAHFFREPPIESMQVIAVEGQVSGTSADGTTRALRAQDVLSDNERISTGKNSSVKVGRQDLSFTVREESALSLTGLDTQEPLVMMQKGAVEGQVTPQKGAALRIAVEGNATQVLIPGGRGTVRTDGEGTLDASANEGLVILQAPGQSAAVLPPGTHRVVAPDGESLASGAIPRSVLLEVEWPEQQVLNKPTTTVKGRVTPGSEVLVEGRRVKANRDGRFAADVSLREGKNQVKVEARGTGEPTTQVSPEYMVDTKAPSVRSRTDQLWR